MKFKNITFGKHSYGDIRIEGISWGKVGIGKYCSIGQNVVVFMSYDHNMNNISTYPFGHADLPISKKIKFALPRATFHRSTQLRTYIGNDVWIGSNTVLFSDITIGDGAVIGAYSIITKDIPPNSIAVGHSRIVRKRFPDEDIKFLLDLKWWDFEDEMVASIAHILCSPNINALRTWAKGNKKIEG